MRLGILTSHPIQYYSPWFRALAKQVDLEVFFAHRPSASEQGQAGFGVNFEWDVDLLSGFKHTFLRNVARQPGLNHFTGCDTPEIAGVIAGRRSTPHPALSPVEAEREGLGFDGFIVLGWYLKSFWQAVRACRRAGVPVLVRGDSQLHTPRSPLKRLVKSITHRLLLRQFDGFLTVGRRNREYLLHYGAPADRIFNAPHFIDNAWFAARAAEARSQPSHLPSSIFHLRNTWGADDATLVALFVGKFQPIKRPQDILRALAILQSQRAIRDTAPGAPVSDPAVVEHPPKTRRIGDRRSTMNSSGGHSEPACANTIAVFVGSGELEPELRQLAAHEKLRVHFAGFKNQSELPRCYAAADVLVLPSESETWGLVVNEGMACGLPAIVSEAAGCAPDLIEEGRTGFGFPVGDAAQLARRLAQLHSLRQRGHDFRPALAEKMSAYSIDAAVAGTLQAVNALSQ